MMGLVKWRVYAARSRNIITNVQCSIPCGFSVFLGVMIGHSEMASDKNLETISETGYDGFLHIIREYETYFDLDDKFEA